MTFSIAAACVMLSVYVALPRSRRVAGPLLAGALALMAAYMACMLAELFW